MLWQLAVPLTMVLATVIAVGAVKMHNASQVLERIVGQLDETRSDEIGRLRRMHAETNLHDEPPHGPRTSSSRQ